MTYTSTHRRTHWLALVFLLLLHHAAANEQDTAQNSSSLFDQAINQLEKSNQSEVRSRQAIVDANALRKRINKLRANIRNASDPEEKKALVSEANTLTTQLSQYQSEGSKLRQQTKLQLKESLNLFEQGIVEKWSGHVRNRSPILMDDRTTLFFSHNTRFRSVHPNLCNRRVNANK